MNFKEVKFPKFLIFLKFLFSLQNFNIPLLKKEYYLTGSKIIITLQTTRSNLSILQDRKKKSLFLKN